MSDLPEEKMRMLLLELLSSERRNLRSKAKTDQRMAEELSKIIVDYAKMRY